MTYSTHTQVCIHTDMQTKKHVGFTSRAKGGMHLLFSKCEQTQHIDKQYEAHTNLSLFVVGFDAWCLTIVRCACLLFITVVGGCFLVCLGLRVSDLRDLLLRTCYL